MADFDGFDRVEAAGIARARLEASARLTRELAASAVGEIVAATEMIVDALRAGHKLLICGNGGSAADAQHIAAEFVSRYLLERRALPAIALTTDTSILTAIGNDYSFDRIFSRQVEALGSVGDVLIGISTSGNSTDVVLAAETALSHGIRTIGFTGQAGGRLATIADVCLRMPSTETPRVQEGHIAVAHVICELAEAALARG